MDAKVSQIGEVRKNINFFIPYVLSYAVFFLLLAFI